jgi:hypothetical protein
MNDLRKIPGIGRKMEEDLRLLDIESVDDLNGSDPELLYEKLCILKGYRVDRCVLYVFRCAVYYATEKDHDPEKLKWWNWKDVNK